MNTEEDKTGQDQSQDQAHAGTEQNAHKEEFKVSGEELIKKVKSLIQEGNARRIIIQNEEGKTLVEIPLTIGAIGAILAPSLAAVGAIAALVTKCTIIVVKR